MLFFQFLTTSFHFTYPVNPNWYNSEYIRQGFSALFPLNHRDENQVEIHSGTWYCDRCDVWDIKINDFNWIKKRTDMEIQLSEITSCWAKLLHEKNFLNKNCNSWLTYDRLGFRIEVKNNLSLTLCSNLDKKMFKKSYPKA